jgi:hypothetical protein
MALKGFHVIKKIVSGVLNTTIIDDYYQMRKPTAIAFGLIVFVAILSLFLYSYRRANFDFRVPLVLGAAPSCTIQDEIPEPTVAFPAGIEPWDPSKVVVGPLQESFKGEWTHYDERDIC